MRPFLQSLLRTRRVPKHGEHVAEPPPLEEEEAIKQADAEKIAAASPVAKGGGRNSTLSDGQPTHYHY